MIPNITEAQLLSVGRSVVYAEAVKLRSHRKGKSPSWKLSKIQGGGFLQTSGDAKAYVQRCICRTFYLNTAGTPASYKIIK